jgi:DNA-binding MarR family transcriptional regulator
LLPKKFNPNLVRWFSASDRRARIVELTHEGKRVAASCFEKHAEDLEALMSVLSQKEKAQVLRIA